jgi:hypothetical protein
LTSLYKLFLIITTLALISLAYLLLSGKLGLVNTQEVDKSFSQFISMKGADEYVIAQLETNEEFSVEKFNHVMGFPIGDTNAKLSLVANYKYYVKLAELTHHIQDGIVYIDVPKLYLSTPVAFEFSSVQESTAKFMFGVDEKALLDQLKSEASEKLRVKGQSQVGVMYDKAAKALADNFNNYFKANGFGGNYKDIVVTFANEGSTSNRQFKYNKSYCGEKPCRLALNLGKGLILKIN